MGVLVEGSPVHPGISMQAIWLELVLCMASQHHAIGLQSDSMVVMPAPVVRLPNLHLYTLRY